MSYYSNFIIFYNMLYSFHMHSYAMLVPVSFQAGILIATSQARRHCRSVRKRECLSKKLGPVMIFFGEKGIYLQ
jgi:hypothetical protein